MRMQFGIAMQNQLNGDFAEAQKVFNAVRRSRTKKIQRSSMMQGKIYHMKNPLLVAARNAACDTQISQAMI